MNPSPIRVVHIEDEPWDSGIAHYAVTLAAEQKRRGWYVEFWGLIGAPPLEAAAAAGVPPRGFYGTTQMWLKLPLLRRVLRERGVQVLDAHTGSAHTLALALAAGSSIAVVRTRGDARPPGAGRLARFAAGRTAAYIGANYALTQDLRAAFPGSRVSMVPQGVEGPASAPPLPAAPVAGMLARLDPVKGHDHLIDAAALLKPRWPALKVVCAGQGQLRERLTWQLKPAGLDRVVEFPGYVADKWAFLASCRVGVVASIGSEAVSRATLEWMAAGRPVVATRVGGIPDLVLHEATGLLVPPGDTAALAEALESLLKDPAKAEALGRAARERWRQYFSPEPFFAATAKAYHEALHRPAR